MLSVPDPGRCWGETEHGENAWTFPLSRPFGISNGLQDRHLAVWASHGRYYDQKKEQWRWQRPGLFGTCEDILTPSIVTTFLMPMLENAGAVVFSPRERDTQVNEVIVDNDRPQVGGAYREDDGPRKWSDAGAGFAHLRDSYRDMQNPFAEGTARQVSAQTEPSMVSSITWTPEIPEAWQICRICLLQDPAHERSRCRLHYPPPGRQHPGEGQSAYGRRHVGVPGHFCL